jgi:nucleoside-diphosphate-sugar epimerase
MALSGARRASRADADMLVHASFAFVLGQPKKDPLRSLAETILECEDIVLSGSVPACVVRLGYLYGPDSRNLRAYRTAFGLGRPYWAGPRRALQYHLHQFDAVSALLAAAKVRNVGRVFYATDDRPVAFMDFMDDFARRVGRRFPLHAPSISKPLMKLVVREEHMQQVALAMRAKLPRPRLPGWKPAFPDYRAGLDQAIAAWGLQAET